MSKSYETRGTAEPRNHTVFADFVKKMDLSLDHHLALKNRGLTPEQIARAQYATKPSMKAGTFLSTMKHMVQNHILEKVPGFMQDANGHWVCSAVSGLVIPVRDYRGHICFLLIRNDKAKLDERTGKYKNKYVTFSSLAKKGGAGTFHRIHCPIIKKPSPDASGTVMRITEGPLKADIATALGDIYTVGMQGLHVSGDLEVIINEFEIHELIISLDQGEDQNTDIIKTRAKLIALAQKLEIDFKVEIWDAKYGKGIDDVLHAGHADKIRYANDQEIEEFLKLAHEKNPENGEWIYVIAVERFYHKPTFYPLKKSQFADKFCIAKIQEVNNLIANGFEQVDGLIYEPAREPIIQQDSREYLNTWRDPGIEPLPCTDNDIRIFIDHIEYLFPEKLYQSIVLDFLAFIIQFPGRKIRWALVIQGDFGVGKSFLAELMKILLGDYNVSSPTMEEIHGTFTHWQKNCQLIVIEELMALGRRELLNKLKPMIVAPMSRIREMFTPEYEQPNRYNLLCFTNYDDPLPLEEGDRRYSVVKTEAKPKDNSYYNALFDWLEKPETAGMLLHYLKQRDLSGFNHSFAPMTQAKQDIIDISLSPLEEWIKNNIEERCWPFNGEIISIRHLKHSNICPHNLHKISDKKWADLLRKYGAIAYDKQVALAGASRIKVWFLGENKHLLMNSSPADIAKRYANPHATKPTTTSETVNSGNKILEFKPDEHPLEQTNAGNPLSGTDDEKNPLAETEPM